MIKTKFKIDLGNIFPIIEGLEKIKSIEILENNVIIIKYTITNDFMKENDLYYKNRILKLDASQAEECQAVQDYANIMEV